MSSKKSNPRRKATGNLAVSRLSDDVVDALAQVFRLDKFAALCPGSDCRRKRVCARPDLTERADLNGEWMTFHRAGLPFCLALIWEDVRPDVARALRSGREAVD